MRVVLCLLGLALVLLGVVVATVIAWSNPDMTARRQWLDYPWEMGGCFLSLIAGAVLVRWGTRE